MAKEIYQNPVLYTFWEEHRKLLKEASDNPDLKPSAILDYLSRILKAGDSYKTSHDFGAAYALVNFWKVQYKCLTGEILFTQMANKDANRDGYVAVVREWGNSESVERPS